VLALLLMLAASAVAVGSSVIVWMHALVGVVVRRQWVTLVLLTPAQVHLGVQSRARSAGWVDQHAIDFVLYQTFHQHHAAAAAVAAAVVSGGTQALCLQTHRTRRPAMAGLL
jgi:hypothetical protein